jgi:DNA-binding transcriptional LysR family regulator
MPPDPVEDLRFSDLSTVLTVHRLASLAATARHLRVTTSQVSKALTRVERHLGIVLFNRSPRGVVPTDEGRKLLPRLHEIALSVESARRRTYSASSEITVAAPSYVNALLLPAMAAAVPELRFRALELPPAMVRTLAPANLFDVTVLLGEPRLPPTWAVQQIGTARKGLLATPAVARELGRQPVPVENVQERPFVSPVYVVGGQYVPVDDDCPLPSTLRRRGHEAQTIALALDLAAATGQLVYGPIFAAGRHLASGELVEVSVAGWEESGPVFFACAGDRVLARVQALLVEGLRRAFAEIEAGLPGHRLASSTR